MPGDDRAELIAAMLLDKQCTLAVAESLTGGMLTSRLAAAGGASSWLRGGLVAYSPEVKFRLLGVPAGPVVNEETAASMARGVADLLGSDVSVALTGVAGPGEEEGQPPGTVWLGLWCDGHLDTALLCFEDNGPGAICGAACDHTLDRLAEFIVAHAK